MATPVGFFKLFFGENARLIKICSADGQHSASSGTRKTRDMHCILWFFLQSLNLRTTKYSLNRTNLSREILRIHNSTNKAWCFFVYFNQPLAAAYSKRWSEYAFSTLFVQKTKKRKRKQKTQAKFKQYTQTVFVPFTV